MEQEYFFVICALLAAFFGGIGGILRQGMPDVIIRLTRAGTAGVAFDSLRKECACPRWELGFVLMALINKRKVDWDFPTRRRMRVFFLPYPFPWHFRLCIFRTIDDQDGHWSDMQLDAT